MQIGHDTTIATGLWAYEQLKFWLPALGLVWGVFKGFRWVKEIREKDLVELKGNVADLKHGIQEVNGTIQTMQHGLSNKLEGQTVSIVDQLKELRSDFRTFYTIPTPQMIPARAKPVKKTVNKTKQKRKTKAK